MSLEAAIEFPAKHAKHAKTKADMRICEALWFPPAGEQRPQGTQGLELAVFRVFSVFGGLVLTNGQHPSPNRHPLSAYTG